VPIGVEPPILDGRGAIRRSRRRGIEANLLLRLAIAADPSTA
jgi:hypothetical protein